MSRGLLTKHLMLPEDRTLAERLGMTVPGMAHMAGTGPASATCRMCVEWGASEQFRRGREGGELRPRQCQKYPRLMQGRYGPAVPHDRPSCRHFVEAEKVPAVVSIRVKRKVTKKGIARP